MQVNVYNRPFRAFFWQLQIPSTGVRWFHPQVPWPSCGSASAGLGTSTPLISVSASNLPQPPPALSASSTAPGYWRSMMMMMMTTTKTTVIIKMKPANWIINAWKPLFFFWSSARDRALPRGPWSLPRVLQWSPDRQSTSRSNPSDFGVVPSPL